MEKKIIALADISKCSIAHTDAGDYFIIDGELKKEFFVKGKIIRSRAGLFIIDIEGKEVSFNKRNGFSCDEEVLCLIEAGLNKDTLTVRVLNVEKL
jgi:hypothetical protein